MFEQIDLKFPKDEPMPSSSKELRYLWFVPFFNLSGYFKYPSIFLYLQASIFTFTNTRKWFDDEGMFFGKGTLEAGISIQCLSSTVKANEQCLTHVLLKIDAKVTYPQFSHISSLFFYYKNLLNSPCFPLFFGSLQLGGLNSLVDFEHIPLVSKVPTIIFGMSVSHSSNHKSDTPSVVAVSYFCHLHFIVFRSFHSSQLCYQWMLLQNLVFISFVDFHSYRI